MKHQKKLLWGLLLIIAYLLCHCCTPRYNQPLLDPVTPEDPTTLPVIVQDSQMLLFTTFSGGGSRAMAMSYYVCDALKNIQYSDNTNLLQEIDYSSGVSGGSFVSAALPIYRNNWEEFYINGVTRNMPSSIIKRILLPWNWPYLISPYYTRTDLASEYYNKYIFKNHTFGTLPKYPKIFINATLLAQGTHFIYTPEYFQYISSDINSYPVGYACAASSAFPVGFAAMTLKNYGKQLPADSMLLDRDYKRAYRNRVKGINLFHYYRLRDFLNNKKNAWLHNQDGGLAGNTGIKRVLDEFKTNGAINKALNNPNCPLKRLVIIVVDAGTLKVDKSCRKQSPPMSLKVIMYTTTTAMNVLSGERLAEVRNKLNETWQAAQNSQSGMTFSSKALNNLEKPFLIEINARNISDTQLAKEFNNLPTSFYMNTKQLKIINRTVSYLLNHNKEYNRLKESIKND